MQLSSNHQVRHYCDISNRQENISNTMAEHSWWRLSLVVLSLVAFIVTCIINGLSTAGNVSIFRSTQKDLSAKYETTVTPDGWTFSIWGFIYAWQALHLLYGVSLLIRKSANEFLYVRPNPVGSIFYIAFILSCVFNITWIFMFDREYLVAALVILILQTLSLYLCIIFSHRQLYHAGALLEKKELKKDIWLTRIFVHNGVAFYCAWTNVASLLNLTIVLHYVNGTSLITCAWLALGILNGIVLVVFILECFVFDKYARYTLAHYITLVIALSGILSRKYSSNLAYTNYMVFLLCFVAVLGIAKLVLTIYRGKKSPIIYSGTTLSSSSTVSYTA